MRSRMHLRTGVRFPPPPLRKYPESHAVGASHLRGVPRRFQSRDLRGYGSRARTTAPSSTDPSGSTQPAQHGKRQVGVLAFDAARPDPSPPRPFQKPCRGLCSLFPPPPGVAPDPATGLLGSRRGRRRGTPGSGGRYSAKPPRKLIGRRSRMRCTSFRRHSQGANTRAAHTRDHVAGEPPESR